MKCIQEFASSKMEKQNIYEEQSYIYEISDEQIDHYIKTGEPMDKAGSYGIQGKQLSLSKGYEGDYYNVVGFPIARFFQEITNSHVFFQI